MKYTSNYNLKKPEPSVDYYDKENDNFNMDAIDGVLKEHADGISAIESELTKVSQTIVLDKDGQSKVATDSQDSPARIVELGGVTMYNQIKLIVDIPYVPAGTGSRIKFNLDGTVSRDNNYNATKQTINAITGNSYFIYAETDNPILYANFVGIQYSDGTTTQGSALIGGDGASIATAIIVATKTLLANPYVIENNRGITTSSKFRKVFCVQLPGTPQSLYTTTQLSRIVGEYFEGLQSQTKVGLVSRNKNIVVNGNAKNGTSGWKLGIGASVTIENNMFKVSTTSSAKAMYQPIKVKKNTYYYLSGIIAPGTATPLLRVFEHESNTRVILLENRCFNTGNRDTVDVSLGLNSVGDAYFSEIQLVEGTASTDYVENVQEQLIINATKSNKFEFSQVPNGTKNTYEVAENGEEACWKRNNSIQFASSDISIVTTPANIDYVRFIKPLDSADYGNTNAQEGKNKLRNYQYDVYDDDSSKFWKFVTASATTWALIVPKGTFANNSEAQTYFALDKFVYEIKTPIKIEPKDYPVYGIVKTGSIASNSDYTEFIQHSADLYSDVKIQYSATLAQSMEDIKTTLYSHQIMLDAKANKKQENWFDPTLLNGWSNYGGVYSNVSYFKDDIGFVHLRGSIVGGINTQGTTLFILPADCRIGINNYGIFPVISSNALGSIQIYSDGRVVIYAGTSTIISLDGISFRAEG